MAKPSFNEFVVLLDDAVNRISQRFLGELTGGFNLRVFCHCPS